MKDTNLLTDLLCSKIKQPIGFQNFIFCDNNVNIANLKIKRVTIPQNNENIKLFILSAITTPFEYKINVNFFLNK